MGNRLFVDTNVFLDLLLNRGTSGNHASDFFSKCIDQKTQLLTSVSCIQTVIYVLQKSGCTRDVIKRSVFNINVIVTLANTTREDINQSIQSDLKDLEDAILYNTAISNDCTILVTQNIKDYPASNNKIRILKPEEFF